MLIKLISGPTINPLRTPLPQQPLSGAPAALSQSGGGRGRAAHAESRPAAGGQGAEPGEAPPVACP